MVFCDTTLECGCYESSSHLQKIHITFPANGSDLHTVILPSVKAVIRIQVIRVTAKLAFREKGGIIYANAIWVATAADRKAGK